MSSDNKMLIKPVPNGPLSVKNAVNLKSSTGEQLQTKKSMILCRCGRSATKPYCDGVHKSNGFSDEKLDGRQPNRVDEYKGKDIVIHDNRGVCAHIGFCTDGLPKVFRMKTEPWIDPDAERVKNITDTIKKCPSGALSYSIGGVLYNSVEREPGITVSKDGPYFVVGGIEFQDKTGETPQSPEHYALCRCGGSKNKPFCDGTHWYNEFKDDSEYALAQLTEESDDTADKLEARFVDVGAESDFEEGKGSVVEVDGRKVAVFKYDGEFGAISHVCAHQGGPLAEGEIKNGNVACPWHGWEYNVFTGKAAPGFDEDVPAHKVKVEGGRVYISAAPETVKAEEGNAGMSKQPGEYLGEWMRGSDEFETKFERMQQLAKYGRSEITPMRTQKSFPDFDSIVFKGAQLFRMPLNEDEPVSLKTVIGKTAEHPLEIDLPFYVSHMSFGALSREAKIALARGTTLVGTMICSGEGGMLPEERAEAARYVYELGTACFSHKDEVIRQADATEIKIGQAAKPGLGGHLPKEKITDEIAEIRGIPKGEDSISPGRHADIKSTEDLKAEVDRLRELTGGKPVGIKFSAGHVEKDIEFALEANPDFITVDCRGGGTGAGPTFVKDNVCLPPIFAIHRARKYLDSVGSEVTLCVTGGFRDSADIAKALALGADAVALATASMVAIGCQQYRICNTGNCPVGIATQKEELRGRFDIERSVERFVNFFSGTRTELETFVRISGRNNVHNLDRSDILTLSREISEYTGIEHV